MSILLFGATGNLGQNFVRAAIELGDVPLEILMRPESAENLEKRALVAPFPVRAASLKDHDALVKACQGIEAIICTVTDEDLEPQLNLIRAAKEAGVKRFIPSEFSCDLIHPRAAGAPRVQGKTRVRNAIKEAGLEWTSIQSNGFMSWFAPAFFNMLGKPFPESVEVYDGGDTPVTITNEVDIGKVALLAARDPEAANSHIVIAFPGNTLSQNQMIDMWEEISGEKVQRVPVSADEIRARKEAAYAGGPDRFLEAITYHVMEGYIVERLSTGELHSGQKSAHALYPQIQYKPLREFYEELAANREKYKNK